MYFSNLLRLNLAQSRLWLTILCASLTIGGAMASVSPVSAEISPILHRNQNNHAPIYKVLQAIQQETKQQFGVSKITVVSFSEQMWPDGCLGAPRGQEVCTTAIVPGWRVEVTDQLQNWVYRSDRTGRILRLEEPERVVLPQPVAKKLLERVAQDNNIRRSRLRIATVRERFYDGCLGVYRPFQPCTRINLKAWQAIVTSPERTYVYHLTQDGERIVKNEVASGAKPKVRVSFDSFSQVGPSPASEVFQSSTSGDLTGKMTRTVLTTDGKITLYQSSPTARFAPVVIRTISPRQLSAFQKTLENSRFANFNALSYLTTAALADYPTTTYQDSSTIMHFIDLEKQSLPKALRQLIAAWEPLATPAKL
jgi:hypothetical protein